jgi:GT2 family glycosyltransferase
MVCEAAARRRDPTLARLWSTQCARLFAGMPTRGMEHRRATTLSGRCDVGSVDTMPRELFFNIGGFDEGYFHAEDLDLCRREMLVAKSRLRTIPLPMFGMSSRSRRSSDLARHRSLWRYFAKTKRAHGRAVPCC